MLLNKADQALIVDVLIAAGKKANNIYSANEYLKLIKKVKALEIEIIVTNITIEDIFNDMDKLAL